MPDISNISVIAELERHGIKYEYGSESEIKVKCPFHEHDDSPSCSVNIRSRLFYCQACKENGTILKLLARYMSVPQQVIIQNLSKFYNLEQEKTINIETVEKFHRRIWNAKPLLSELYARGVTDALIRKRRYGESDGRVTIPIPNEFGSFVNIRKYLPGAPGKDKMRNMKGYSKNRLYPVDQLRFDTILICGGEVKADVAAEQLNRYGIGAITSTAGENNWDSEFTKELKSKRIIVCLDIDKAGQTAANRICLQIRSVADWTGNLVLPLDIDKYPKGDINDFIGQEKGELKPLIDACAEYVPTVTVQTFEDDTPPEDLDLAEAINADKTAKRIRISAVISAMDTAPYIIPEDIEILCERDAPGGICAICPVQIQDQNQFSIPSESPTILELVASAKEKQLEVVKSAVGIPKLCRVCDFQATKHYNIEDVRLSPKLSISQRSADRVMQPALCIGSKLDLNECYNLTGRMFPHPKTQQATLLISHHETSQDALSTFELTDIEQCSLFWPNEWTTESVSEKLNHIYSDLSANVTQVYQRQDIHFAVDLTYHSPLYLTFDGKPNVKGYIETLIMGDTSQGKSEIACGSQGNAGLMTHYGLGVRIDSKNATTAGILGGVESLGNRWFVSWGVVPTNDRRLVIFDELKGMKQEVLAQVTDMRSSGKAQITKIQKRETFARCRLLMISNAHLKLSRYNVPIQAVPELIGAEEDIRRFDLVLLIDSRDVDEKIINQLQENRPQVEHTYTQDVCRKLILWAWTRTQQQIFFTDDATKLVLTSAIELCGMFTEKIPIVDKGSMRFKLARLSASLASRTFSCSEDYTSLIVDSCHVEYIVNFLKRIYSAPTFGYLDYTKAISITEGLKEPEIIKQFINQTPFPSDLVTSLLGATKIDKEDLQDWTGYDRESAQNLLSLFVRKHAVLRDGKTYRKSAAFITLLRQMTENGICKDRPQHIKNKEF